MPYLLVDPLIILRILLLVPQKCLDVLITKTKFRSLLLCKFCVLLPPGHEIETSQFVIVRLNNCKGGPMLP